MDPPYPRRRSWSAGPALVAGPAVLPVVEGAALEAGLIMALFGGGVLAAWLHRRGRAPQPSEPATTLERAFAPAVPDEIRGLRTSVAARTDSGGPSPHFYDIFPLPDGRVALIGGTVLAGGRHEPEHVVLTRHAVRAHLEAGLAPRQALARASSAVDGAGDVATAAVAVHDPENATLTYATAGHPPPVVAGAGSHQPLTHSASPPLGLGVPTGLRQSCIHLPAGTIVCLHTAGITETLTASGRLEEAGLRELIEQLEDVSAAALLDAVAAVAARPAGPMAACVAVTAARSAYRPARVEEIEASLTELDQGRTAGFLRACGLSDRDVASAMSLARVRASRFGAAVLRVRLERGNATAEIRAAEKEPATARRAPSAAAGGRVPRVPRPWSAERR